MKRRLFLQGLGLAAAAPAIVRLDSLMLPRNPLPLKVRIPHPIYWTVEVADWQIQRISDPGEAYSIVDLYTQDIQDQLTRIQSSSLVAALKESVSRDFHKALGVPLTSPAKYQICSDNVSCIPYPVRKHSHPDHFADVIRGRIG